MRHPLKNVAGDSMSLLPIAPAQLPVSAQFSSEESLFFGLRQTVLANWAPETPLRLAFITTSMAKLDDKAGWPVSMGTRVARKRVPNNKVGQNQQKTALVVKMALSKEQQEQLALAASRWFDQFLFFRKRRQPPRRGAPDRTLFECRAYEKNGLFLLSVEARATSSYLAAFCGAGAAALPKKRGKFIPPSHKKSLRVFRCTKGVGMRRRAGGEDRRCAGRVRSAQKASSIIGAKREMRRQPMKRPTAVAMPIRTLKPQEGSEQHKKKTQTMMQSRIARRWREKMIFSAHCLDRMDRWGREGEIAQRHAFKKALRSANIPFEEWEPKGLGPEFEKENGLAALALLLGARKEQMAIAKAVSETGFLGAKMADPVATNGEKKEKKSVGGKRLRL